VNSAVRHVREDQKFVDRAIEDRGEILDMIMQGNVTGRLP
jgi:hypothetical protein